ncbi:uncharacterized protein EDB91DRAFT_1252339 [Suillus paluster]|uniref:uncharacterized protein n=1 Tax=Suillus paluster TaxID=48578 RepID=UPI001B883DC7|nr:uncharacterized protein EDB91DRAFT_1252339 [Suillus paluster]KAG1731087.1 hypothetical protein EDB91DRAFT_1252339 [Suillus paluster]
MPKTKAKIRELCTVTPSFIVAAAGIFVLSGNKELVEIGNKSQISYKEYHNYYCQSLTTGGTWADSIFTFFNNSLFATSSSVAALCSDVRDVNGPHDMWEEDFEHAMEIGEDAPLSTVSVAKAPILIPQSISTAMQGLAVADSEDGIVELPPTAALNKGSELQPPVNKPISALVQKPKPKPRHKTKAGAGITEALLGGANNDMALV